MSSGPMGLDSREYAYGVFRYTLADTLIHNFSTQNAWLVTRIQAFAAADPAALTVHGSGTIFLEAGGCITLEPNGAHRGVISFSGDVGSVIVIEYWYQATPSGNTPLVNVSPP